MMHRSYQSPRTQGGTTLISLLVAMAIGIFLVGGVLKIYLDSKVSYNTRNAVSEVAENQRFAIDDMRRILVMVGRDVRGSENSVNGYRPFPAQTANGTVDGGTAASDIIAVRYRRGPSCGAYQAVSTNERPSMVRFLVDNNSDLICELTTYAGGTPTTSSQVMISNVHRLKILYGVDTSDNSYANHYLPASLVTAAARWNNVVSMRIGLMAGSQSTLPGPARKAYVGDHDLLGLTITEPDLERMYKVASTTLSLRNMNALIERD